MNMFVTSNFLYIFFTNSIQEKDSLVMKISNDSPDSISPKNSEKKPPQVFLKLKIGGFLYIYKGNIYDHILKIKF